MDPLKPLLDDKGYVLLDGALATELEDRGHDLDDALWSAKLLEQLGVRVPLESERGYHLELHDAEGGPSIPMALAAYKFVATPMEGRLRLAGIDDRIEGFGRLLREH